MTPHASVEEFFHEVVSAAIERQAIPASDHAEHYLVSLLGEFTRQAPTDEPLSIKLVTAAEGAERVRTLKEVGDTSLYITGFFADSLARKLVKADYYMNLGEAAYRELSSRLAASRGAREVYTELAQNFPSFVEVLAEVSRQVNFAGSDVGKLYETWLATRAEWVERRLRGMGVLVEEGKATVH